MKNIIPVALMLLPAFAFAENNDFTLKLQFDDVPDTLNIVTSEYANSKDGNIQAIVTDNGKIDLNLFFSQVGQITLYRPIYQQLQNSALRTITIPALPGDTVELTGTTNHYRITGSNFYKQYVPVNDLLNDYMARQMDVRIEYSKRIESEDNAVKEGANEYAETEKNKLKDDFANKALAYIKANPSHEAAATLLAYVHEDSLEQAIGCLTADVQNGRMTPVIAAARKQVEKSKTQQTAKNAIKEGAVAPDFTLNDVNGKPLTLSSLRGKYVLLDFWGSWCGWCIKGFPKLKEYYNKYQGKFEVLGIDCKDSQEKWKAAIAKYELSWLHVFNSKMDIVPEQYAIQGFPTQIMIAPDGTISKISLGETPEFYQYIDSLFSE